MRKTFATIVSAILFICAVGQSHAAVKWTGYKTISEVQVGETGGFLIYFESEVNPLCTAAGTNSIYIFVGNGYYPVTAEGLPSLLSAAMTGLATGMKANVIYDDSVANCWGWNVKLKK